LIELLIARGILAYDEETKAMLEALYAMELDEPPPMGH